MKRVLPFLTTLILLSLLAGTAWSVPYIWTDEYDPGTILLNAGNPTLSYDLDITNDGFNPGSDTVNSYRVWINLIDDQLFDASESASIDLPGSSTDGSYRWVLDNLFGRGDSLAGIAQLNSTGLLSVTVNRISGDFNFCSSSLVACGDQAPVPEPATLLLLGSGLLGLAGFRKKMKS